MIVISSAIALPAVIGSSAATAATNQDRSATRPSILLIVTDDQRWDTLWAMPHVRDLLANRGTTFSNAFVVNPLCCPSRSSILTGNYSQGDLNALCDPAPPGYHPREGAAAAASLAAVALFLAIAVRRRMLFRPA